ncbi:MAG: hypothetical protein V1734_02715 [Nanoarchaeota archaeon]
MEEKTKKRLKTGGFAAGAALSAMLGFAVINTQCGKPNMTYEDELLQGTASYVEHYSGDEPGKALQYALSTLEVVAEAPTHLADVSSLEKELGKMAESVENEPSLYPAVMDYAAEKIGNIAGKNEVNAGAIAYGMLFLIGGVFLGGTAVYTGVKKKITP